jgi:hypothetical protein
MSQQIRANNRNPASASLTRAVPINESPESPDSRSKKINAGQAFLRVVEYPWGVEFDVVNMEGRQ